MAGAESYLHAEFHLDPSSIQPFGHNTPTSQTGQTDRTGQTGQRYESIGRQRTVLQTVAQKRWPYAVVRNGPQAGISVYNAALLRVTTGDRHFMLGQLHSPILGVIIILRHDGRTVNNEKAEKLQKLEFVHRA